MYSTNQHDTSLQYFSEKTDEVFGNDLLMEIILTYVIHGQRNQICLKNLTSVRLVDKHWLETVSRLIRKSRKHVYDLDLHSANSLNHKDIVQKTGKELDRFTSTFTSKDHLEISLLPASVYFSVDYFKAENFYSLLSFFTKCGQHLKAFSIQFPIDGGSMPFSFPQFSLPNLKDICFQFVSIKSEEPENGKVFGDNRNGLAFLQSILNASSNLKELDLAVYGKLNDSLPLNFEYLRLPETLTSIILSNELTTEGAEFLLQNKLPLLQELVLTPEVSDDGNESLFNVLEHFRGTLRYINLSGGEGSLIRFPLMENLEILELTEAVMEFNSCASIFQNSVPKLKTIIIDGHAESWIYKFSKFGGFTSVQEIELKFSDDSTSVTFNMLERLHKTFPNLQRLNMFVNMDEMVCLKYLFGEMKQLKTLEIKFRGIVAQNNANQIQSLLLGLPKESKSPGLQNLSELRKLHLTTEYKLKEDESSLLTELIFQEGLQQMVNLQMVLLSGKFKPTTEMLEEWRKQDRFIEYRDGIVDDDDKIDNPFELSESLS